MKRVIFGLTYKKVKMKSNYQKLLNEIWYFKISPLGFFNGMEIIMYPNYELVQVEKDFDFKACEVFLKEHIENNHKTNQICFPKYCWKLKGQSKQTEEWVNSPVIEIRTDTKIGQGGRYQIPRKLLRKNGNN